MNKRQAKKAEQKLHLVGGSYQREKQYLRRCHEESIAEIRRYVKKGTIPEDLRDLMEIGIYTKEEVDAIIKRNVRRIGRWVD